MSRSAEIEELTAAAHALGASVRGLGDDELLEESAAWEVFGRLADARRAALAAEVQWRSRPQLREDGLAFRRGERSATDLLTRELRISGREAKRRVTLGTSLAPRISLTGQELEGRYPATTSAVQEGAIALDAAKVIVEALDGVRRRAVPEAVEAAEQALAQEARHTQPDLLQIQAAWWAMRLDQDGAAPDEEAHPHCTAATLLHNASEPAAWAQQATGLPLRQNRQQGFDSVLGPMPRGGEGRASGAVRRAPPAGAVHDRGCRGCRG